MKLCYGEENLFIIFFGTQRVLKYYEFDMFLTKFMSDLFIYHK